MKIRKFNEAKDEISDLVDEVLDSLSKKEKLSSSVDGLKKEEQRLEKKQEVDIEKDAQNISTYVTMHKNSVERMMDNLSRADGQTLMKIRVMLGMDKNNAPL